jgi:hypothetical protein
VPGLPQRVEEAVGVVQAAALQLAGQAREGLQPQQEEQHRARVGVVAAQEGGGWRVEGGG